jgi:hypothetical protein
MNCSLFKFAYALHSALLFWELLAFEFLRYVRRDISIFNVCFSSRNSPSARCASAANVVYRDDDVFGTKTDSLII